MLSPHGSQPSPHRGFRVQPGPGPGRAEDTLLEGQVSPRSEALVSRGWGPTLQAWHLWVQHGHMGHVGAAEPQGWAGRPRGYAAGRPSSLPVPEGEASLNTF